MLANAKNLLQFQGVQKNEINYQIPLNIESNERYFNI